MVTTATTKMKWWPRPCHGYGQHSKGGMVAVVVAGVRLWPCLWPRWDGRCGWGWMVAVVVAWPRPGWDGGQGHATAVASIG